MDSHCGRFGERTGRLICSMTPSVRDVTTLAKLAESVSLFNGKIKCSPR